MKPLLVFFCYLALVVSTALVVRANIAKPTPPPQKQIYSSLEVVPDPKVGNATLRIRASELKQLQAALDGIPSNNSLAASITHSGTRTIIAGMLLFLSVSFAGVWLARASRSSSSLGRGQKTVAIVIIAVATIGAAAIITRGNAGPPPGYTWRNLPTALGEGQSVSGPINIVVLADDADMTTGMRLIIPLKKRNAKGEEE